MSEQVFPDILGNLIVLTASVQETTLAKHPEAAEFVELIPRVLLDPDEIRRSSRDDRVVLYYRFESAILNGKWIVAVVKRVDRHFISTFYATSRVKSGDVLWKR